MPIALLLAINEYLNREREDNDKYWWNVDYDEPPIKYFTKRGLKEFSEIGYAYIDGYGILHIIKDKSFWERYDEVPKTMMKTTLPHAHGFPIDKNGNAIIIRREIGTNNIEEKYGRSIPKMLKRLYRDIRRMQQ